MIRVEARGAGPLEVELPDAVNVSGTKAFSLSDVKPGMVLGVTTIKRADGETVAIDVRPIPATAPLGLSPFDLVLNYKSGTVKVLVPPGTPMSQSAPGSRADIKPGETIFIVARIGAGDKLTAARVQVSTNGVKPTQ